MHKKWITLLAIFLPFFLIAQEYEVVNTFSGHQGGVQNIRFSDNGSLLASCGKSDFQVAIWDMNSKRLLKRLKGHTDIIYEVTFNKQGNLIASASKDGSVRVWDIKSGELVGRFENQPVISPNKIKYNSVAFVSFSSDSKYVFFGGDNGYLCKGKLGKSTAGAFYQSKRITSVNTHNPRAIISITGGTITADGRGIMTSIDHFVHVTDIRSEQVVKTFYYPFDYINDVIVGPGRNHITTWSYDGKVTIWDYHNQRVIKTFQVTAPKNYSAASFNSGGQLMTTGAFGNSARVWSWQSGQAIAKLSGHSQIVRISRFSPTKQLIATGSYDGTIKLWKPKIEEETPDPKVIEEEDDADISKIVVPHYMPGPPPKDKMELFGETVEKGKIIELKNVQFEQSRHELSQAAKDELDKIVMLMRNNPSIAIEIHGHTDDQGHAILNFQLSEKRAEASKNYLVSSGINAKRIVVKAFGEQKPIANNKHEGARKKNRRVEIKIVDL